MSQAVLVRKPVVDWLTVVAIAAIAISLNVAFHEGVHALACLAVGGDLQEYSALYESCDSSTELQAKIVAGSAPTYNLIAGVFLWIILRIVSLLSVVEKSGILAASVNNLREDDNVTVSPSRRFLSK